MNSTPIRTLLDQFTAGDVDALFLLYDWLKERQEDTRYRGAFLYLRRRIGALLQVCDTSKLRPYRITRVFVATAGELEAYLWEDLFDVPAVMVKLKEAWQVAKTADARSEAMDGDMEEEADG